MARITSYPSGVLKRTDYIIGTDISNANVTRSYLVSEIANTIIASLGIGTVTSISTVSSAYISVTGGPITAEGTITADISATGTPGATTFLRGDGIWSLPGPAPNVVSILFNGNQPPLSSNVDEIKFTGNVVGQAGNDFSVSIEMPGSTSFVDNAIAGTAISVSSLTGNVVVGNTGVLLTQAGGNVTLSGGTGAVTVNSTANPGSVVSLSAGFGIADIVNSGTNPIIALNYAGSNNYIIQSVDATVIEPADTIEFNQITSSSVKAVEISDIPETSLTAVKKYIDDADANTLKNITDTFKSTQKAINMVSCTIVEHTDLVNGGTVDENTLYFILGAGTSFTVNPQVTNLVGSGTGTSTSPTSFSGVVGSSYTFTTNITNVSGTYNATGSSPSPVTTSGVVVNNAGNPYNQPINITGSVSPPANPTGQARYTYDPISHASSGTSTSIKFGFNTIWRFVPGYTQTQPGSLNPIPAATSGSFSFNAQIELMDTDYEFYSVPRYELTPGGGNFQVGATNFTGALNFNGNTTDVKQIIKADYQLKEFLYTLIQVDQIVNSDGNVGIPQGEYSISLGSTTATGSKQINTVITGSITIVPISPFAFSDGAASKVFDFTSFPITSNIGKQLTFTGTMIDTTPVPEDMVLAYTDNISGTAGEGTAYTLSPTTAAVNAGTEGSFSVAVGQAYNITAPTATIISNSGYFFSTFFSASQTSGSNPLTGTMPAGGGIANQTLAGVIGNNVATYSVQQVAVPVGGAITYQSTFSSNIATNNISITGNGSISKPNNNSGNGSITVSISRTSPSSNAQQDVQIDWYLNGNVVNTYNAAPPTAISQSFTVTGVSNGDTVLVIIDES